MVGSGSNEGDTNGGAADVGSGTSLTDEEDEGSAFLLCSRSYSDIVDMVRWVFCGRGELSGGSAGDACAGYAMIAEMYTGRRTEARTRDRCERRDRRTESKVWRCHHPGSLLNRCFWSRNGRLRLGPLVADTACCSCRPVIGQHFILIWCELPISKDFVSSCFLFPASICHNCQ